MNGHDLLDLLRRDTPRRRQLGITIGLVAMVAGLFFYLYAGIKLLPDLSVRMLAGGAVFLALAAAGPRVTLPMYFATMFGTALLVPGLPVSLNQALAVLFVFSWAVSLLREPFRMVPSAAVGLLAIYTIYAVAVGMIRLQPGAAPSYQQLMYLLMTFAVASTFRRREHFLRLMAVFLAITCAISSVGLAEFILGRDLFPQFSDFTAFEGATLRINGIAKNAIQFAFDCTWMLPWALVLHIESKSRAGKALSLAAMGYLIVLCLLTFNRQSPIIIAAMFAVGLPLIRYRYRTLLIVLLTLAAVAASPFVVDKIVSRFASIAADGRPDMSIAIRRDKLQAARLMIADHPWLGVGLNNFKDRWWQYTPPGELYVIQFEKGFTHYVDLGYLQIVTETGAVGSVMFLLIVGSTVLLWVRMLRRAARLPDTFPRNATVAAGMVFIQLSMSMLLQDTFFIPRTYILYGLLLAVLWMIREAEKEEPKDEQAGWTR